MESEKVERRALSADKNKRAQKGETGPVRKIDAGLVIAGHRYCLTPRLQVVSLLTHLLKWFAITLNVHIQS